MAERTPQELASNIYSLLVYPIFRITSLAICCTSRYTSDFTSPAKTTCPVVTSVSQATFELGSKADRKSTRLNSSHVRISYAVFCLKKKKKNKYYIETP